MSGYPQMSIKSFLSIVMIASFSHANDLNPFESSTMIGGYCHAGSRKDDKALGGYGSSGNAPKKITEEITGTDGQITLVALPADAVPFMRQYAGFRLLLINRTAEEAPFSASDSRLYITCEARGARSRTRPRHPLTGFPPRKAATPNQPP